MEDDHGKVKRYRGGRFEQKEQDILKKFLPKTKEELLKLQWLDTGNEPKDITTLCLNIIVYKLSHCLSMDCKIVMSATGEDLYIVMKAD